MNPKCANVQIVLPELFRFCREENDLAHITSCVTSECQCYNKLKQYQAVVCELEGYHPQGLVCHLLEAPDEFDDEEPD